MGGPADFFSEELGMWFPATVISNTPLVKSESETSDALLALRFRLGYGLNGIELFRTEEVKLPTDR